jgi:2-dehydropantoate 2-reductase
MTLQNGLGNEQALAEHLDQQRIVGGLAFVCINRTSPGVIAHSHHGHIRIGEFVGPGRSARTEQLAAMFNECNVRAAVADDLRASRWDKQVWNIPFNGLGALLDATTDQLIGSADGEALVRAIMAETISAARADGVTLTADTIDRMIEVTRPVGAYFTSTQLDRRNHRPMEIEAIFGQPVHIARRHKLHLPLLEMLYFSLHRLDIKRLDEQPPSS